MQICDAAIPFFAQIKWQVLKKEPVHIIRIVPCHGGGDGPGRGGRGGGGEGSKMEKTGGLGGRGRSVGVIGSNVVIQRFNILV